MQLKYNPKGESEKFAWQVYDLLREDFPKTYFVGGVVRDLLLKREITDIDIATSALPTQVMCTLEPSGVKFNFSHIKFGVIVAEQGKERIEIATFRKDLPSSSRYPQVTFLASPKADSARRDFTMNALYWQPELSKILDFHSGQNDLLNKIIRTIGNAEKRFQEDPLRMVRALRFQLQLNLQIENKTNLALEKYFYLVKKLSQNKINKEISKLHNKKREKRLQGIINSLLLTK